MRTHHCFSYYLNPSSYTFKYCIANYYTTKFVIFPILDVLASILVSQEKFKFIVTALQLNSKKKEIFLSITKNEYILQTSILTNFKNILGSLQR